MPGYQVVEFLGTGARSTIWRVRHRQTQEQFALKQVLRQPGDDSRYIGQALNEYEVGRHLDHPTIRRYLKVRKVRRWFSVHELHLVMELCEGTNCQSSRPTDLRRTVAIFHEVAAALAHMHARGYVHADMKPNNIMIDGRGKVKIIDLGQSCPIGTVKERIQGTPDFIAPEQVHRRPLDGRTDVFNFGAALYWVLTGQAIPTVLPKQSTGIQLVSEMAVTPPVEYRPEVPGALNKLVLDCIEMRPSHRPQAARELVGRLDMIAHTLDRNGGA